MQPAGAPTPDGREVEGEWARLRFDIVLAPADVGGSGARLDRLEEPRNGAGFVDELRTDGDHGPPGPGANVLTRGSAR